MGLFDRFKKPQGTASPAAGEDNVLVPGVGRIPFPAYRGKEPYIFISYAHADSGIVFPEIKRLNDQGYHVWYDEGIAPGNEWTDEIADALSRCSIFVVMMTPDSAGSHNVQNEINYAIDEQKPFMAIHLLETNLRGGLKLQIGSKQALLKYNMTENEYAYKYTSAFERMGISLKSGAVPGKQPAPAAAVKTDNAPSAAEEAARQRQMQREIERIQNSPATVNDFEWTDTAVKAYHGIKKCFAVPDGAASILPYAFENNNLIEQVTLPAGVSRLGAQSFSSCGNLELVIIKNDHVVIEDPGAFYQCPKLKVQCRKNSITYENLRKTFTGDITFFEDTAKAPPAAPESLPAVPSATGNAPASNTNCDGKTDAASDFEIEYGVLKKYSGSAVEIMVPQGVVKIAQYAFDKCDLLEKVTLPEKLRSIETCGFCSCTRLQAVNIPRSVTYLFSSAFINCPLLVLSCYKDSLSRDFERAFSGMDIVYLDGQAI